MDRIKLGADQIEKRLNLLKGWRVENDTLRRRFEFKNFAEGLVFVNRVGTIAESADHHPDICFGWGYAEIAFTTHDRGGITEVDFVLAEKVDGLD